MLKHFNVKSNTKRGSVFSVSDYNKSNNNNNKLNVIDTSTYADILKKSDIALNKQMDNLNHYVPASQE